MMLKSKIFSSLRWNGFSSVLIGIGGFIQLLILVQFLEKSDFGLMAIVNLAFAFAMLFLDLGFNNGIIQKKDISEKQLSSLYWSTIFIGALLSITTYFSSPFIAAFYEEERLIYLIRILSPIFIISAFGNQFRVLMLKKLSFDHVSYIKLGGFFIQFFTVIFLAIKGYGVLALIYGLLAKIILETIIAIYLGRNLYRLQLYFNLSEIKYFFDFGLFQIGEKTVHFFFRQMDVLIIGKFLGTELLGVYDIIKKIMIKPLAIINPIITSVMLPTMSIVQDDIAKLRDIYLKQLNNVCSINFPLYIFFIFNTENVISVVLGQEWLIYKSIFNILAVVYMFYVTGNIVGTLLLSKGKFKLSFFWTVGVVIIVTATLFSVASKGLLAIATSLLIIQCFVFLPNFLIQVNPLIKTTFIRYHKNIVVPLFLSLLAIALPSVLIYFLNLKPIVEILISLTLSVFFYFVLSNLMNRAFINDLTSLIRE